MNAVLEKVFNAISADFSSADMMALMDMYEGSYLVTIFVNSGIEFLGEISDYNKQLIRKSFELKEFYEIGNGVFRMVLSKNIYVFKKFGEDNKTVLVGVLVDKSDENRLDLMQQQVNHLITKCESW